MAIITHEVTVSSVIDGLPFAQGAIGPSTPGLNTTIISNWIREAAGILNAHLASSGVEIDNLKEDERQVLASGIHAFARAMCLEKRRIDAGQVERQWEIWREARAAAKRFTGGLGQSDPDSVVASNFDYRSDSDNDNDFGSGFTGF